MLVTVCLYSSIIYRKNRYGKLPFFLTFTPILTVFTLIPGLQYAVGRDYFAYISLLDDMSRTQLIYSKEYLFYSILLLISELSLSPQVIFILSSGLISLCFMLIIYRVAAKCQAKSLAFFLFLLVTTSTIFHGQMNILRQSVAMAFFMLASTYVADRKYIIILICFFISFGFHSSS
ncbi:EpsG family protein, partial [Vibrio alginolyticus]|nr:EpsG family protein [Vibrio alginolyticus]